MESEARHVRPYRFFRIFKARSVSKRSQAYLKGEDTQHQDYDKYAIRVMVQELRHKYNIGDVSKCVSKSVKDVCDVFLDTKEQKLTGVSFVSYKMHIRILS